MRISEIIESLEKWAHPSLQEDYDNSRLIVGNRERECTGALISLDCTEEIVNEAFERGCNLVISHHPVLFTPLKTLTGQTYTERILLSAIEKKIALYALHTNLDNIFSGVNQEIAERIGLTQLNILRQSTGKLMKLVTYVPTDHLIKVREALFAAGAGHIGNYDQCSFSVEGTGTFRPQEGANPYSGKIGHLQEDIERRLEMVFPAYKKAEILKALKQAHPYEEVAYEFHALENALQTVGAGMSGILPEPLAPADFLKHIKTVFGGMIRFSRPTPGKINKVALCGGSGSFLLPDAIACGADVFISSDFKYHQFFDADHRIMVIDIGHYEAEQFTSNLIQRYLNENFSKFAVLLTNQSTNPVQYL